MRVIISPIRLTGLMNQTLKDWLFYHHHQGDLLYSWQPPVGGLRPSACGNARVAFRVVPRVLESDLGYGYRFHRNPV